MSTTETILTGVFWCSAVGVVYAYLAYPVLIALLSRIFGEPPAPPCADGDDTLPRVALLIAAHNEANVIESRIRNALSLDYPRDRLEIVIASDGSDDGTPEICRRFPGVRTFAFPQRRGKPATLNEAMTQVDAELVALSDANTFMDRGALRRLARWFADPRVGAVCGRLLLNDPRTGRNADSLYWRYETFLKRCEARLGALLGANGAIYAIRRSLYEPLSHGTIIDDFVIPLAAKLRTGCRIIYDREAVAFEETAPDLRAEFRRRARIGAGGWQAIVTLWPLLSPRSGWTALSFFSHKVLRWACPFLLIGALATSASLWGHHPYREAFLLQTVFYGLCVAGALLPAASRATRVLRVFPTFAGINLALLVGFARWVSGRQSGIWTRTARLQDLERTA